MKLQARPYRDPADLLSMRHLVMVGAQAKIPASYMHPGCLDWDTQYPPDEEANQRNLRLWENLEEEPPALAAWAIFSRREGSFDLFVSPTIYDTPQHARIMDEYMAWAEARPRGWAKKALALLGDGTRPGFGAPPSSARLCRGAGGSARSAL